MKKRLLSIVLLIVLTISSCMTVFAEQTNQPSKIQASSEDTGELYYKMGIMYFFGNEVEQDYDLALTCFKIAYESGITDAENYINYIKAIPTYSVTISFAGDCTLGEFLGQTPGNQFKDYSNLYGTEYFFSNVKSIFENDDLTFVNLEGALTSYPQTAVKTYPIKGLPESVNCLTSASVEVCNLSNNHIYDCGIKGFEETKSILSENNIGYCGEGNIYTTTVNGVQVSFLGYVAMSSSSISKVKQKISQDMQTVKDIGSDLVCVEFHWGTEYNFYSEADQEELAHYAIDSGADIVVGAHPHVIQGIERYNGKLICYSLGNFCFGANKNPSDKDTFILQQTFTLTENGIEYADTNIIPCSVSSSTTKNTYQPTPLTDTDAQRVINRLETYSSKYADTLDFTQF